MSDHGVAALAGDWQDDLAQQRSWQERREVDRDRDTSDSSSHSSHSVTRGISRAQRSEYYRVREARLADGCSSEVGLCQQSVQSPHGTS